MLGVPETLQTVSIDQLARLAAMLPQPPAAASHRSAGGRAPFDLPGWIAEHGLSVVARGPWNAGGQKWILNPCPWNPDHTNRAAYIVQFANGAIAAGCTTMAVRAMTGMPYGRSMSLTEGQESG